MPVAASVGALGRDLKVADSKGEVSDAATRNIVAGVAAEGHAKLALHHLQVMADGMPDVPLYRGNTARLLIDGPQALGAMRAAIAGATRRVLLESYIFEDEGLARQMADLLRSKAAQGVQIAVIYDSVGSLGSEKTFFEELRAGGVAVCGYNPVSPFERAGFWNITQRDHRKLLVVDDRIGYTGGINISQVYASGSFSLRRRAPQVDPLKNGWRDTQIEVQGPIVPALAESFEHQWNGQGCEGKLPPPPTAPTPVQGERVLQLLLSQPGQKANPIYRSVLRAIDAAQQSVHLTMAYFAPGEDMLKALCDASRRGVQVVLVLPSKSDFGLMLAAGRGYYQQLLEAGVQVHELQDAMLHAKTAVVDGVWSTVGSSNLDWRSFADNAEINLVVVGDDFAQVLEAQFQRDLQASAAITPAAWAQRGLGARLKEWTGRLFERWL